MKPRGLQCACCGSYAGRFLQFNNQDDGYGICRPCVLWVQGKHDYTPRDIAAIYGAEGVNYATEEQWNEIHRRD